MSSSDLPSNTKQLSVEANVTAKQGEGVPRRHPMVADGQFVTSFSSDVSTLYDSFTRACFKYGPYQYLGYREKDENGVAGPYQWLTYAQVKERVDNFASGLVNKLNLPEKTNVGIYSINRVEWVSEI
jgi:hypothetical protein